MCFYYRYLKIIPINNPITTIPITKVICTRCLTKIAISYSVLCVTCTNDN